MQDLRIHGKNMLLGLFRSWSEKQIVVKVRAGRENPNPDPGRVKKRPLSMGGIVTAASTSHQRSARR